MPSTIKIDLGFLTGGAGLYEPEDSLPDGAKLTVNAFDQVLIRGHWFAYCRQFSWAINAIL